jgi:subtilisin family serine protease
MIDSMLPYEDGVPADGSVPSVSTAQTTGRYVVVFAEESDDPSSLLGSVAGLANVASSGDFEDQAVDMAGTEGADATVMQELGLAVVTADPDQVGALQTSAAAHGNVVAVAPELVHHAMPSDYLRGYLHGVTDVAERLGVEPAEPGAAGSAASPRAGFQDTDQLTWGLQATLAATSGRSGRGVRVAVLDTGMDTKHPDFVGRSITARSFVSGESVQDGHGHGTHCIGTACGPKAPAGTRRYGVAYEAEIWVGKVLSNRGSGSDGGILAGINWAVANRVPIISMSLGADVPQQHPPYTYAGRRALERGSLVIAAAGNNANRPGNAGFVAAPANSPDVLAVGAVDSREGVARFSARTLAGRGGQVDIAGPGVAVYSSWPMPVRYRSISGTSMATPHVAGLAALWVQATGRRGLELWGILSKESRRSGEPSVDVGSGLVQAGP